MSIDGLKSDKNSSSREKLLFAGREARYGGSRCRDRSRGRLLGDRQLGADDEARSCLQAMRYTWLAVSWWCWGETSKLPAVACVTSPLIGRWPGDLAAGAPRDVAWHGSRLLLGGGSSKGCRHRTCLIDRLQREGVCLQTASEAAGSSTQLL